MRCMHPSYFTRSTGIIILSRFPPPQKKINIPHIPFYPNGVKTIKFPLLSLGPPLFFSLLPLCLCLSLSLKSMTRVFLTKLTTPCPFTPRLTTLLHLLRSLLHLLSNPSTSSPPPSLRTPRISGERYPVRDNSHSLSPRHRGTRPRRRRWFHLSSTRLFFVGFR